MATSVFPLGLDLFGNGLNSDFSFPYPFPSPYMSPPLQGNSYPFFHPQTAGVDPNIAMALYQQQQQQLGHLQQPLPFYPPGGQPTPTSETSESPGVRSPMPSSSFIGHNDNKSLNKRSGKDQDGPRKKQRQEEPDDDEDEKDPKESKPKTSRGSRCEHIHCLMLEG